jgi:hypothetical protein
VNHATDLCLVDTGRLGCLVGVWASRLPERSAKKAEPVLERIGFPQEKRGPSCTPEDTDARREGLTLLQTRSPAFQDYKYGKDYFAQLKEELGADA